MIELQNAEKLYGNTQAQRKKAGKGFHASTLSIPEGQIVGLFGENGAGKSTLLRAIAGISDLTSGAILFDGTCVQNHYDEIAFITGEGSYFSSMTPNEYGQFLSEFFPRFTMQRYHKLLAFFDVDPSQNISKMSTGQRAKVEIAAGIAKRARYLLMDEPFLGKDLFTRRDFLRLLAGSLRGEETIILATHNVEEVESFIDRAIILHKGRIVTDVLMDDAHQNNETLVDLLQQAIGYDTQKYKSLDFGEEE